MADWSDPQVWEGAYRWPGGIPGIPGYNQILSYLDGRTYVEQLAQDGQGGLAHYRHRLTKLGAGGFNRAADTLIIGAGFGWLLELIIDLGSLNVWGCDNSTLIQSLLSDPQVGVRPDVQTKILSVDFTAPDAADQFLALAAGNNKGQFRNVVTEHLLEDWPTADLTNALDACEALMSSGQSNVYHLVTAQDKVQSDPVYMANRLTLAEWAALRPSHFWIDEASENVAGGGQ